MVPMALFVLNILREYTNEMHPAMLACHGKTVHCNLTSMPGGVPAGGKPPLSVIPHLILLGLSIGCSVKSFLICHHAQLSGQKAQFTLK